MKIPPGGLIMQSRRSFLKFGFLSLAALTGQTANAVPTLRKGSWDQSYDVVVIGAGGAGLAAACVAAQSNLKTVVLEKQRSIGGSSILCGGKWSVAGTDEQKAKGIKDSPELFLEDMLKTGQYKNDPELVKAFIKASREHYEFMTKERGLKPKEIVAAAGMSVPRAHNFTPKLVLENMRDYINEHAVKIVFNTRVEKLIWDPDKDCICGVQASTRNKTILIEAKKGVIIASGGFARNKELLKKYAPPMAKADAMSGLGSTGDGLLMAQAYGADVLDTQYIKATYGYRPNMAGTSTIQAFYGGAILVNSDAKRFVNESLSYKLLGDAALSQKDGKSFEFFDEPLRQARMKTRELDRKNLAPLDGGKEVDYIFRGQTIEEVAKKAGLDPKALVETVKRYNENVDKGIDPDFGRTTLTSGYGKPIRIETGPFYLYPATARLIATYCGLRINTKAEVLDVYGKPIANLYAAGEVTGGIHGAAYMTGTAWGKAMAYGRIAAQSIAQKR